MNGYDDPLEYSEGGMSLTIKGRAYKAFYFGQEFSVLDNTIIEFDFKLDSAEGLLHAICLDSDLDDELDFELGNDRFVDHCFRTAGTECNDEDLEGSCFWWVEPEGSQAIYGTSGHYRVKVGHYFQESIEYISFIQASGSIYWDDGSWKEGLSTFGNITVYNDEAAPHLDMQLNGQTVTLGRPVSYTKYDMIATDPYQIFDGGRNLTLYGRSLKAFELNAMYTVQDNTVLEFDFELYGNTQILHAICLIEGLSDEIATDQCFWLEGTECSDHYITDSRCIKRIGPSVSLNANGTAHFRIPVGHYYQKRVSYLAFIQASGEPDVFESDQENYNERLKGQSSFGNIQLYDDTTAPKLTISANDVKIQLGSPISYADESEHYRNMDSGSTNPYTLSSDGETLTLYGRAYKAFPLSSLYEVQYNTILEFDFSLQDDPQILHAICLDEDVDDEPTVGDRFIDNCFKLEGSDCNEWQFQGAFLGECMQSASSMSTNVDGSMHFRIEVGQFILKKVRYLAFIQASGSPSIYLYSPEEFEKSLKGVSTFHNIRLFEDPGAPQQPDTSSNDGSSGSNLGSPGNNLGSSVNNLGSSGSNLGSPGNNLILPGSLATPSPLSNLYTRILGMAFCFTIAFI